jgi:predicted Zn-dependent protease with MMP-like domain
MEKRPADDPELQTVEQIYDALDTEQPEQALRIAREALARSGTEDPVVHFLAGLALLELDKPDQAVAFLEKAASLDPDDSDMRANLALSLFLCSRFDEAQQETDRVLAIDDGSPDGHYVAALLLERADHFEEADRQFERAAKLDPERFASPGRLEPEQFEQEVLKARAILDDSFKAHLDRVVVTIDQLPSDAILQDDSPPLPPDLFGLFVGVPRIEQSSFSSGGELPPRILLFQRNLERCFPDPAELATQIAITLHHELGHYLGMDEDHLDELRLL